MGKKYLKQLKQGSLLLLLCSIPALTFALEPSATRLSDSTSSVPSEAYASDLIRAQKAEMKALSYRQKMEVKELKASQKVKWQEWEKQEREERHKYFEAHAKGPERRAYIQDFLDRREKLQKFFKETMAQRLHDHESQVDSLREGHSKNLKELEQFIKSGKTPPKSLWPHLEG